MPTDAYGKIFPSFQRDTNFTPALDEINVINFVQLPSQHYFKICREKDLPNA